MFWLHVCLCAGVRSPKLDSRELMPCVCWCCSKIVLTAEPSFQSCFCSFLVYMLCRECVPSARLLQETRSSCNSGSVWLAACSKIHCWEWPLPACFLITVYTTWYMVPVISFIFIVLFLNWFGSYGLKRHYLIGSEPTTKNSQERSKFWLFHPTNIFYIHTVYIEWCGVSEWL